MKYIYDNEIFYGSIEEIETNIRVYLSNKNLIYKGNNSFSLGNETSVFLENSSTDSIKDVLIKQAINKSKIIFEGKIFTSIHNLECYLEDQDIVYAGNGFFRLLEKEIHIPKGLSFKAIKSILINRILSEDIY